MWPYLHHTVVPVLPSSMWSRAGNSEHGNKLIVRMGILIWIYNDSTLCQSWKEGWNLPGDPALSVLLHFMKADGLLTPPLGHTYHQFFMINVFCMLPLVDSLTRSEVGWLLICVLPVTNWIMHNYNIQQCNCIVLLCCHALCITSNTCVPSQYYAL